jgi:hypothetical protein
MRDEAILNEEARATLSGGRLAPLTSGPAS